MKYNKWLTAPGQLMEEASQRQGIANTVQHSLAWQRGLRGLTMAVVIAGVSACSSNYTIKAIDGTVYHTQGAPTLEGGAYKFVDAEGQQQQLFLSKVSQVEKR
jgi:hypothetical protein